MLTEVRLIKAMVFPVVMYGCESWTIKKPERQRIDAFELWCWRRLLRVPWTARRSNQSILKEISPDYSLKGRMLKLKLQSLATWCIKPTLWKRPWCWERLKVGGEGDNRGWDGWMASPTRWTWVWVGSGGLVCCSPRGREELDTTEWLTELNSCIVGRFFTSWATREGPCARAWEPQLNAGFLLLCRLFSSCGEQGLLSSCRVWASLCSDFSLCGAQALGHTSFSSCSTWAH